MINHQSEVVTQKKKARKKEREPIERYFRVNHGNKFGFFTTSVTLLYTLMLV